MELIKIRMQLQGETARLLHARGYKNPVPQSLGAGTFEFVDDDETVPGHLAVLPFMNCYPALICSCQNIGVFGHVHRGKSMSAP